jgi:hypothetical protein
MTPNTNAVELKPWSPPYAAIASVLFFFCVQAGLGMWSYYHYMTQRDPISASWMLATIAGKALSAMLIGATFTQASVQSLREAQRLGAMSLWVSVGVGFMAGVLEAGWSLLSAQAMTWVFEWAKRDQFTLGEHITVFATIFSLLGFIILPSLVVLAVKVVARLSRPAAHIPARPVSRAQAVALLTLFAWCWVTVLLTFLLPNVTANYAMSMDDTESGNSLFPLLYVATYFTSFILVLPVLIGALLGVPKRLSAGRPWRLLGISSLCMLLCGLIMAVLDSIAARLPGLSSHASSLIPIALGIAVVWYLISIPACKWLIRALTLKLSVEPEVEVNNVGRVA